MINKMNINIVLIKYFQIFHIQVIKTMTSSHSNKKQVKINN
jgi:hypothetical protein